MRSGRSRDLGGIAGVCLLLVLGLAACSAENPAATDGGEGTSPRREAERADAVPAEEEMNMRSNGADRQAAQAAVAAPVRGTISGTHVELTESTFDDQLAIFESDGWGFSPSLLIFLFLDEGESPEGRTFSVSPEDEMSFDVSIPHVHYRWRGAGGNIQTNVVPMNYSMELKFGRIENGELPGEITFSVPGENTSVQGTFRAKVEE